MKFDELNTIERWALLSLWQTRRLSDGFEFAPEDVRRQYRRQALQLHPDRPTGNKQAFCDLKATYDIVCAAMARAQKT